MEGVKMIERISKIIKLGILLSITGTIIIIIYLVQMFHRILTTHPDWANPDFELSLIYANLILGIALSIVGIFLYTTGIRDLYFRPLKQLLYPQLKQNAPVRNPIRVELRLIECKKCNKSIPLDSQLCPYCGLKQFEDNAITLKNI
jgi:hypothetical protein